MVPQPRKVKRTLGHWWHDPTSTLRQSVSPERTQWKRARVSRQVHRPDIGHIAKAHPTKRVTSGRLYAAGKTRNSRRMPLLREISATLWNLMFSSIKSKGSIWGQFSSYLRDMKKARRSR